MRRLASLKFRKLFMDMTGIDPLQYMTIAKAANVVWKSNHMPQDTVGIFPVLGYARRQWSRSSIVWLDWEAKQTGKDIRHALNYGEKEIIVSPNMVFSVDGYHNKEVWEFDGCKYLLLLLPPSSSVY